MEFEHSSVALDLRFIPDEVSFEGRQVRDKSSSVPSSYQPPSFICKVSKPTHHTTPYYTILHESARENMSRCLCSASAVLCLALYSHLRYASLILRFATLCPAACGSISEYFLIHTNVFEPTLRRNSY